MKNESKKEIYFIDISVSQKQKDIYRNDKINKNKNIYKFFTEKIKK